MTAQSTSAVAIARAATRCADCLSDSAPGIPRRLCPTRQRVRLPLHQGHVMGRRTQRPRSVCPDSTAAPSNHQQARYDHANTCSEAQLRQTHHLAPPATGPLASSPTICNTVACPTIRYGLRKLNACAQRSVANHFYDALMPNRQDQVALTMPALSIDARGEASR